VDYKESSLERVVSSSIRHLACSRKEKEEIKKREAARKAEYW
jgi:hypothetical protein